MTAPQDLRRLTLRREDLNIFVLGPGYGESIVIDLPGPGWLVIDGAGRSTDLPVHQLLEAHLGADFIDAMLLTHPHRDHYIGMRELIEHETLGPRLRRIGCVAALVEDDRGTRASKRIVDTGNARALLERVVSFWAVDRERRRLDLVRGPISLATAAATARVLAPTQAEVDAFTRPAGRRSRLRQRANEISVVLELRFGAGRYLFTGDLSAPRWRTTLQREPDLGRHELLKLPHHGSEGAQPPGLLRRTDPRARTWVLTPFNRGASVSRPPTSSGIHRLLEYESTVHITSFPVAWRQTTPLPARVSADELHSAPTRAVGLPRGRRVFKRTDDRDLRQRDSYWLFCFDSDGNLLRTARGAGATRIVAPSEVNPSGSPGPAVASSRR